MSATKGDALIRPMPPRTWIEGVSSNSRWLAASDQAHVLFGMDWMALVGGAPIQLAKKHIRLYRASMHTPFDNQSTVLGIATEAPPVSGNVVIHSAAALFADAYRSETAACMIVLAKGECWMVAAHQGKVLVQTDRWFESLIQAGQAIAAIEQRFPDLKVDTHHLGDQMSMPAWACSPGTQAARLIRTKHTALKTKKIIVSLSLVSILTAYLCIFQDPNEASAKDEDLNAGEKLQQNWQDILGSRPVHGGQDIIHLISTWNQVPVLPGGWRLVRIDCQPEISQWRCIAAFHRSNALATAESLIQSLPAAWMPEFIPLDQASVTFTSEASLQKLDTSKKISHFSWLSRLQKLRVAFEHIQVGPPVSMLHRHEMTALEVSTQSAHASVSSWVKRSLQIRGPLRSFSLFKDWEMPGWWRQVTLELRDGDLSATGNSRFVLTLNGELYERKD